jgi:cyclophilin family peptidyl-prolyl cis-trans isomerase
LATVSFLDGAYTVFGNVVKGMDVVDAIATHKTDPRDNPIEPVTILKTSLISPEDVPQ